MDLALVGVGEPEAVVVPARALRKNKVVDHHATLGHDKKSSVPPPMVDPNELEGLVSERAIRQVLLRYCRGIDRMDQELVRSCYHHDAVDDHGSFRGSPDEYVAWAWRLLGRYDTTMHFLGNMLVEFDGDDVHTARAETYGIAFHRSADPDPRRNLIIGFRYVDRFERRPVDAGGDPQWRIARRVCTTEWVQVDGPARRVRCACATLLPGGCRPGAGCPMPSPASRRRAGSAWRRAPPTNGASWPCSPTPGSPSWTGPPRATWAPCAVTSSTS